jgi:outer membrane biosynthesis protein TonB
VAARPAPARPSPPQSPQPPQQAEAPRRVASTPRESEPVAPAQPAPAPAAVPAPPAPIAAPPPAPEAPTQPVETATRSENTTPSPAPARGESERPPDSPPGSQVAALPPASSAPSGRAYVPDIRSLGRGSGGAGGLHGAGRGGVEGDPVSLDTGDPRYSDYLILVKRAIEHNMTWPCVRSGDGRTCDHKPARLVIEFGIRKNGELAFIAIRQPSNYRLMDEVSENAVKLASFPPLPEAIRREHPTGLPILANFLYEFNLNWVIR